MRAVGIRFKQAGKVYTFDAGDLDCAASEWVVVETERGMALGQIVNPPSERESPTTQPVKRVLRKADERDILRYEQNCELEGYAYQFCAELIREKDLPMKLVDVEYLFDGSKAIFYFAAETRVDFRELVRDLARQFHTRIEMRQIGVRDEAKIVGGVGCCGRELCCAAWLSEFAPISVRMAKDQHVSLNPTKISGICGRLMCCLSYEHQVYKDLGREMPKVGKRVETPLGEGKVVRRNVLESTFVVAGEEGEFEVTLDQYYGRTPAQSEEEPDTDAVAAGGPEGERSHKRLKEPPRRSERETPVVKTPEGGSEQSPAQPQAPRRRRRRRKKTAHSPQGTSDG